MNICQILVISVCAITMGCSHLAEKHLDAQQLTLDVLNRIKPGVSTANDVRGLLGTPGQITKLDELTASKEKGEVWEYFEKGATRASITVGTDNIVNFWGWYVYEEDEEHKLRTALDRFPDATWMVESVKWVNPHSWPNECYFTDNSKGVTVEFHRARKEVAVIERWNPTRKPAATDKETPPTYCIDNFCGPALPYKEMFGNKPLCDMPK
ncbi:MAG: hypothetical protein HY537_00605 [Deltaproteobacteria bacterium]|nr:hypothetical protein [Deltaproteobacteria bacterium]